LYTADIHLPIAAHGLVLHQYADDCQIYIAMPANETSSAVSQPMQPRQLHGITDSLFWRLQSIQNAAAHMIMGTRRLDHITLILRDLQWLPVGRHVEYKLALLVYKLLHRLVPPYLAEDCILASSDKFRCHLRSTDVDTCIVPRTRTCFGDWSSAAGPRIWNSLPPELRQPDIELGEFCRLLKTFLFV